MSIFDLDERETKPAALPEGFEPITHTGTKQMLGLGVNAVPTGLVACQDCGGKVSRHALTCPHCGRAATNAQVTVSRIAGGIVLGYICIVLLTFVVMIALGMLGMGILGGRGR